MIAAFVGSRQKRSAYARAGPRSGLQASRGAEVALLHRSCMSCQPAYSMEMIAGPVVGVSKSIDLAQSRAEMPIPSPTTWLPLKSS